MEAIMALNEKAIATVDGVKIINTTPHEITFGVYSETGEVMPVGVAPCGVLINAKAMEEEVSSENGVTLVRTKFEGSEEGKEAIKELQNLYSNAVIVGSIIAAQAYPGEVVGMTPLPGFERVAPAEKRMNPHKFTTFE